MNRAESGFQNGFAGGPPTPLPGWRLHGWGDFAITAITAAGVRDATPRSRKARALLAWLAFHADRPVSRERLAGLLWGDRAEEQARASLRQILFELRPFTEGATPLLAITRTAVTLHSENLITELNSRNQPEDDEPLFANLDDIDESFDNWLRALRAREIPQAAAASRPLPHPAAPPPAAPPPAEPHSTASTARASTPRWPLAALAVAILLGLAALFVWSGRQVGEAPGAIAVLAFEAGNEAGDPARAQSLADDIRLHLARNPAAEVLGRNSSTLPRLDGLAPAAAGQAIGASHVLWGRIATSGAHTRVEASLTRSADGQTIWNETFEAAPDGLFAVQRAIGNAVEKRLGLGRDPRPAKVPRGDTYALVLAARELAASQEPVKMAAAEDIMRRAVAMDPGDARAHAALARALFWRLPLVLASASETRLRAEAVRHAETALRLAPDLADAHLAMADARTSFADPAAGLGHLQDAVRLDPGLADTWMAIALLHKRQGQYPQAMNALRKAVRLEPYWWPAFYYASEMAWNLGHRAESLAISERVIRQADPFLTLMVKGDIAWRQGRFADEVAAGTQALAVASEGQRNFAYLTTSRALRAAGLNERARQIWPFYTVTDEVARGWDGIAPSPARFAALAAGGDQLWAGYPTLPLLFANLINAGRSAELVAFLDRSGSSPAQIRARHFDVRSFLASVPPLVLALRAEGRDDRADALTAYARAAMQPIVIASEVPADILYLDAQLLMVEDRPDAALARLEQAAGRGWLYATEDLLPDLGSEPAFRPLRGNARFESIRAAQNAHTARERAGILAASPDPGVN